MLDTGTLVHCTGHLVGRTQEESKGEGAVHAQGLEQVGQ